MSHNVNDMSKKSGEENIKSAPRYELPTLRSNGKTGRLFLTRKNDAGEYVKEDVGEEAAVIMLKVRRIFGAFSKTEIFYTNEHNHWKDKISLFRVDRESDKKKSQLVGSGTIDELKLRCPVLKMKQIVYCMLPQTKEVIKMEVKGKGLSNLYEYWKAFEKDEHIFQFETLVTIMPESGELGDYFAMNFTKADQYPDMDIVSEKMDEVVERIEKIEAYYAETAKEYRNMQEDAPVPEPEPDGTEPAGEIKNKKSTTDGEEDEIKIEDIPF